MRRKTQSLEDTLKQIYADAMEKIKLKSHKAMHKTQSAVEAFNPFDESENRDEVVSQLRWHLKSHDTGIFIKNDLPYVIDLEQGYSDQAPMGFMRDGFEYGLNSVGIKGAMSLNNDALKLPEKVRGK